MSEELFVRYCSPTLAGIKTGSLFSCSYTDEEELSREIRHYNHLFVKHGLCLIPMRMMKKGKVMLYLFRTESLKKDLSTSGARFLLRRAGYSCKNHARCLARLRMRLAEEKSFPHEIGLFLGYPTEDVKGFIEQGPAKSKLTGYWKVYGDEESALRIFRRFDSCSDIYEKRYKQGEKLEALIV